MKVCFVINDLQLSGGVGVILEHSHQLAQTHGMEVTLALTGEVGSPWEYRHLSDLNVVSLDEAVNDHFDVAVATWWETAYRLFEVEAQRYAYFVQNFEDRFYLPGEVERLEAATTHDLPVAFISEARWIVDALSVLRPDAPVFYVRNGIAKDVFSPLNRVQPNLTEPLRVVVEGHPDVWFKAVGDSLDVLDVMDAPRNATLVCPDGAAPDLDRVMRVGPLSQPELASLYADTDVILKLSRVEGMFGPPLEAFHKGATCLVTPVTGHEEYVTHGWNGLVADWDDTRGAARRLDLLAQDRRALHFLRYNALQTARAWPSWEQAGQFMAAALRSIKRRPPVETNRATRRLMGDIRSGAEDLRLKLTLRTIERDVSETMLERKTLELDEIVESRAYRFGVVLRGVWKTRVVRAATYPFRLVYRLVRRIGRR